MTPKQEAEKLMNEVLPVAERMLREHREFYPFGGCLRLDGSIAHIGATDPETDHPKSSDLLFVLKDSLREMAGRRECRAVAVVFDVAVILPKSGERSDSIQVNIEHVDGYSVEVFLPYRFADGNLIYGEILVQQGKREIFSAASSG